MSGCGGARDLLGPHDPKRAIVVDVIQDTTRFISLVKRRASAHEFQSWQVIEARKRPVQKCPVFCWHVAPDDRINDATGVMQSGKQIVCDLIDLECEVS